MERIGVDAVDQIVTAGFFVPRQAQGFSESVYPYL